MLLKGRNQKLRNQTAGINSPTVFGMFFVEISCPGGDFENLSGDFTLRCKPDIFFYIVVARRQKK